jgi:NAD(P)H-hydrate epimerase
MSMLVTCSEMRALEESAFSEGISAESLMEEAGAQIAAAVRQFFFLPGRCVVFAGKGHNGGDALVAARHLQQHGWEIDLREPFPRGQAAALTQKKALELAEDRSLGPLGYSVTCRRSLVVLDGLLGLGAGGALREPIRSACREIHRLRREQDAHVFALDLPTGLDGDTGAADADAVVADATLTIGFAKAGLLTDGAVNHVGRLAVLPLRELAGHAPVEQTVATAAELQALLPRRAFDTHKGGCGRVGIVAGARGYLGAAVLCAEAAIRGGAGLVTLYVPEEIYPLIATRVAPEVMVRAAASPLDVLAERHDVLAIGPGLGRARDEAIRELIARAPQPAVVDADALNALADAPATLDRCAGPRLLTPHPGEMARLDPLPRPRREIVGHFTARWPHALLLKGARSLIGQRGRPLSYNSTGHPGLATGGMGDVLTGLCAALAAQGLALYDAARLGAWLLGRGAEIAVFGGGESAETLRPSALLDRLGAAFADLRAKVF